MMRQILFSLFFSMMCAMNAAAAEAYAVTNWFTPDSITMTFYYDDLSNNYEQRPGEHWFFLKATLNHLGIRKPKLHKLQRLYLMLRLRMHDPLPLLSGSVI